MPSSGWMRTTRRLRCSVCTPAVLNRCSGTSWKVITTRVSRVGSRLPVRSRKGTPDQRHDSRCRRSAAYVSVVDVGETPGSSRYPTTFSPSTIPAVYCPRTTSCGWIGWIDCSTLTFSLRIASASKESGGSIATSESTWNMWFWTMSRMAPISSYSLPRCSTPSDSATVISTREIASRFQIRSNSELPKRKTRRFCTVSLPM